MRSQDHYTFSSVLVVRAEIVTSCQVLFNYRKILRSEEESKKRLPVCAIKSAM